MRHPTNHSRSGWVVTVMNGAKETRTPDPLHAMQVLYQLSYGPRWDAWGELPRSPVKEEI